MNTNSTTYNATSTAETGNIYSCRFRLNTSDGCFYERTCRECLDVPTLPNGETCALSENGVCGSIQSRSRNASFPSGTKYCQADDAACGLLHAVSNGTQQSFHRGVDGCVCVQACEMRTPPMRLCFGKMDMDMTPVATTVMLVIGCVIGVVAIAIGACCFARRRRRQQRARALPASGGGDVATAKAAAGASSSSQSLPSLKMNLLDSAA